MRKFWLLLQDMDEHGHFCAYVRPVTTSDNINAILRQYPEQTTANIYSTKKEAGRIARMLNEDFHNRGIYIWDFMEDGKTPAPF